VDDEGAPAGDSFALREALGPTWGFHVYGNVALGNLVDVVRSQTDAYTSNG
jgi:hypothetical protein